MNVVGADKVELIPDTADNANAEAGACLRRMPWRACKQSPKAPPVKVVTPKKQTVQPFKMGETMAELRKIYCGQMVPKFRPSNLQTIYEESESEDPEAANDDTGLQFSKRKLRRWISFSDDLNVNKARKRKRALKVRKLGLRVARTKISYAEFHERLNKGLAAGSIAATDGGDDDDDDNEDNKAGAGVGSGVGHGGGSDDDGQ